MSNNSEFDNEKTANISTEDMLFVDDIVSDNKIIINIPLIDVVGNDLTRAAMYTRYMFFYKLNNYQAFSLTDKQLSEFLHVNIKTIERHKRWLKENGLISVKMVGVPAVGFITLNIQKARESYKREESSTLKMRELAPAKCGSLYIDKRYNKENIYLASSNNENNLNRKDNFSNPIKSFENSINRKSNYLKATIKQQQNISSEEKEENKEPWEKYPAFMKLWAKTPEFSRGCGIQDAFNEWMIETENGTKNVEEIDKGLTFHFKATPKDTKTKHLTKLLMYGTWKSFLFEANEVEKKKLITEEAKKERKTKEEQFENLGKDNDFATLYKKMMGVDLLQKIKEDEEKQNEQYR